MNEIKCDKCDKFKDKFSFYYIQMPVIYGASHTRLKICESCFGKMWSVQIEDERRCNPIEDWSND